MKKTVVSLLLVLRGRRGLRVTLVRRVNKESKDLQVSKDLKETLDLKVTQDLPVRREKRVTLVSKGLQVRRVSKDLQVRRETRVTQGNLVSQ